MTEIRFSMLLSVSSTLVLLLAQRRFSIESYSMLRTVAAIAMLMVFGATAAYPQGATTAPRSADGDLFRFAFNKQPLTAQNRVELVRLFDAYCREVLDNVPTSTPAEDTWVVTEQKTVDIDRISRLTSSKEWARKPFPNVSKR
jgi:hypothetical protein